MNCDSGWRQRSAVEVPGVRGTCWAVLSLLRRDTPRQPCFKLSPLTLAMLMAGAPYALAADAPVVLALYQADI
ncbi:hypothetical protein EA796_04605 [Pseudomonas sp. AOB-7]|nr:hypothetical protein EA796_04605 [Pseudomonas sp. AOB-7]